MTLRWPPKDPDDVKDYRYDLTDWLDGDTIASFDATVAAGGIVIDSSSNSDEVITVWLSGGTAGQTARVHFNVVTAGGRAHERTVEMRIRER
jgi:hypothetical protein